VTPSETLIRKAEERANTPENQRAVLALVLDRATSAMVGEINREIGRWEFYNRNHSWRHPETDATLYEPNYRSLLKEYVQLKLHLHVLRRRLYHDDACLSNDEVKFLLDRCQILRERIEAKRTQKNETVWGGLEPANARPAISNTIMCDYTSCKRRAKFGVEGDKFYCGVHYSPITKGVKGDCLSCQRGIPHVCLEMEPAQREAENVAMHHDEPKLAPEIEEYFKGIREADENDAGLNEVCQEQMTTADTERKKKIQDYNIFTPIGRKEFIAYVQLSFAEDLSLFCDRKSCPNQATRRFEEENICEECFRKDFTNIADKVLTAS
jgi:hypothetical protein